MFETVILIGALAAGSQLSRPSQDVYKSDSLPPLERHIDNESSTMIDGTLLSGTWCGYDSHGHQPVSAPRVAAVNSLTGVDIAKSFNDVGIGCEDGFKIIERATEVLASQGCPARRVQTSIAFDPEEDVSYLSVMLKVDTDFETALNLDYLVTRSLVKSFASLPSRLSVSVSDNES